VVQWLATPACSSNENAQVLDNLRLAREVIKGLWTQCRFDVFVAAVLRISVFVHASHATKIRRLLTSQFEVAIPSLMSPPIE
jgi:hypothetical protein